MTGRSYSWPDCGRYFSDPGHGVVAVTIAVALAYSPVGRVGS